MYIQYWQYQILHFFINILILFVCMNFILKFLELNALVHYVNIKLLEYMNYEDWLISLHLPSLSYRQFLDNMFQVYYIINHRVELDPLPFLSFSFFLTRARGHNSKVYKPIGSRDACQHVFSYRIINHWNNLPMQLLMMSLNQLKLSMALIIHSYTIQCGSGHLHRQ